MCNFKFRHPRPLWRSTERWSRFRCVICYDGWRLFAQSLLINRLYYWLNSRNIVTRGVKDNLKYIFMRYYDYLMHLYSYKIEVSTWSFGTPPCFGTLYIRYGKFALSPLPFFQLAASPPHCAHSLIPRIRVYGCSSWLDSHSPSCVGVIVPLLCPFHSLRPR